MITGPANTKHIPLKEYSALLAAYLRPLRRRMGLLAFLLFTATAVQLVSPQIIRYFIDAAVEGADPDQLALAALCFLAAGSVGSLFSVGMALCGQRYRLEGH